MLMARKDLSDFNYDYQKYADYLESAECTNDDGYDVIADQYGNVYTPTDGDWTKGHGHENENTDYNRPSDHPSSKGRSWKNPWLKYTDDLILSFSEAKLLKSVYGDEICIENKLVEKNKELSKKYK